MKIIAKSIEIETGGLGFGMRGEGEVMVTIVINDEDIKILEYIREEGIDLRDIKHAVDGYYEEWGTY